MTSYVEYEPTDVFEKHYASIIDQYKAYKRIFLIDKDFNSNDIVLKNINLLYTNPYFTGSELELKLRMVRIYFDATTFDKIVKESAAKGVDMLSAIGGTMGLLTGFSIISGVEILYFVGKAILKMAKKKI